MSKVWYKSKTVWFNAISLLGALLLAVAESAFVGPDIAAGIISIVNVINLVLRGFTSEAITAKSDGS